MSSLKACKRAASREESRLSGLMFRWGGVVLNGAFCEAGRVIGN